MRRPFSEACEQNKDVILDVIRPYIKGNVLEIGSGTGQHAVHFADALTEVTWQTSDLPENLPGISAWIEASGLQNLPQPIELDALGEWPAQLYDSVYSANCFHIMGKDAVAASVEGIARCLKPGCHFAVYGPFNYDGQYTSLSNARFDQMLKNRDPGSGIKDFEWLQQLAEDAGLQLLDDIAMPANNRTLIWQNRTL